MIKNIKNSLFGLLCQGEQIIRVLIAIQSIVS